ncbi:MAG: hypothetical protein IJ260_11125 [Butyrivibrio sp.]|nr:hypothetical protein [Butyrivibrio sp.]
MVKKLRKKFVITATLSLLLILVIMIAVINLVNLFQMVNDADNLLNILCDNNGYFPGMLKEEFRQQENASEEPFTPEKDPFHNPGDPFALGRLNNARSAEMPYMSRYFFVTFDSSGNVTETDTRHVAFITEENASEYAQAVYASGKERGFYHSYRYKSKTLDDSTKIIVFIDLSSQMISAYKLLGQSLLIGAFALIAMFILVFLFSGQAVAPVVESLEKQKRFITDAGHELKTPLAVISANVDVLELESGKSEWTGSIKNQVKRMNSLVKNMLTLSRMDEERMHVVYSDFDMSAAVKRHQSPSKPSQSQKTKNIKWILKMGFT